MSTVMIITSRMKKINENENNNRDDCEVMRISLMKKIIESDDEVNETAFRIQFDQLIDCWDF